MVVVVVVLLGGGHPSRPPSPPASLTRTPFVGASVPLIEPILPVSLQVGAVVVPSVIPSRPSPPALMLSVILCFAGFGCTNRKSFGGKPLCSARTGGGVEREVLEVLQRTTATKRSRNGDMTAE